MQQWLLNLQLGMQPFIILDFRLSILYLCSVESLPQSSFHSLRPKENKKLRERLCYFVVKKTILTLRAESTEKTNVFSALCTQRP